MSIFFDFIAWYINNAADIGFSFCLLMIVILTYLALKGILNAIF